MMSSGADSKTAEAVVCLLAGDSVVYYIPMNAVHHPSLKNPLMLRI